MSRGNSRFGASQIVCAARSAIQAVGQLLQGHAEHEQRCPRCVCCFGALDCSSSRMPLKAQDRGNMM
jgi:hypothetical protein